MNPPRLGVCTILAKNYLSFARTLFQSLQAYHPSVKCYALVVDEWQGWINPSDEKFKIMSLNELAVPDCTNLAFKYDITEFSTAVKPFLLAKLLAEEQLDKLFYLDPDILITHTLDGLFASLDNFESVIVPHVEVDYPDDNFRPNDRDILRHGVFNLGFIGVRRSHTTNAFLEWWQHKVKTKCVQEPSAGYYVDQRFIDLAICLFPGFYIERDPGYDVAYWNLHSRELSGGPDDWRCNGGPLYFFHFSGYAVSDPTLVSKNTTRYKLQDRPDLALIFADYRRRLTENGISQTSQWNYSFGSFADGEPIPRELRVQYRIAIEKGMKLADPFQSRQQVEEVLSAARKTAPDWRTESVKSMARDLTPPVIWRLLMRVKGRFGG